MKKLTFNHSSARDSNIRVRFEHPREIRNVRVRFEPFEYPHEIRMSGENVHVRFEYPLRFEIRIIFESIFKYFQIFESHFDFQTEALN